MLDTHLSDNAVCRIQVCMRSLELQPDNLPGTSNPLVHVQSQHQTARGDDIPSLAF